MLATSHLYTRVRMSNFQAIAVQVEPILTAPQMLRRREKNRLRTLSITMPHPWPDVLFGLTDLSQAVICRSTQGSCSSPAGWAIENDVGE